MLEKRVFVFIVDDGGDWLPNHMVLH